MTARRRWFDIYRRDNGRYLGRHYCAGFWNANLLYVPTKGARS